MFRAVAANKQLQSYRSYSFDEFASGARKAAWLWRIVLFAHFLRLPELGKSARSFGLPNAPEGGDSIVKERLQDASVRRMAAPSLRQNILLTSEYPFCAGENEPSGRNETSRIGQVTPIETVMAARRILTICDLRRLANSLCPRKQFARGGAKKDENRSALRPRIGFGPRQELTDLFAVSFDPGGVVDTADVANRKSKKYGGKFLLAEFSKVRPIKLLCES